MSEKQKIQGVSNKELALFVGIIACLFILIIFEVFFFEGRTEVAEEMAQAQEELEKMQSVTVATEQKIVYHAVNDIVTMMNDKDYQGLYNMLKDDYKNYYFREYEDFEEFITAYTREKYYPKYTSYYRDDKYYYIMIDFLKQKYTREELLSEKVSKVDTIVLEEQEDGSFKFAMNGFVEEIIHDKHKIVNDVEFILVNSIRNTETMKSYIMVSNNSDKSIVVSSTNIQPDIMGGVSAKISTTSTIFLQPGEFTMMDIEYYMKYDSGKELRGISIAEVACGNGTVIKDVYLAK